MCRVGSRGCDFDRQAAAAGHGVSAVDDEVCDHLFELAAVGLHDHRLLGQRRHELDVFADHPLQECVGLADDLVQVEHLGVQHLLASEGEQLPRQSGGPVGADQNLADVVCSAILSALEAAEGELAVPLDRDQQVVEVVCHAARKLSERLQLLGLAQPGLELRALGLTAPLLGHVDPEGDRADDLVRHRRASGCFSKE